MFLSYRMKYQLSPYKLNLNLKAPQTSQKEEEEEEEIKEEESFLLQVLNSAERWISQMGWSNLPNPVSIPHTIWQTVLLKKGTVSFTKCPQTPSAEGAN